MASPVLIWTIASRLRLAAPSTAPGPGRKTMSSACNATSRRIEIVMGAKRRINRRLIDLTHHRDALRIFGGKQRDVRTVYVSTIHEALLNESLGVGDGETFNAGVANQRHIEFAGAVHAGFL